MTPTDLAKVPLDELVRFARVRGVPETYALAGVDALKRELGELCARGDDRRARLVVARYVERRTGAIFRASGDPPTAVAAGRRSAEVAR